MQTRRSFSAHLLRRRPQSLPMSRALWRRRDREYQYPHRRRTGLHSRKALGLIAMKEYLASDRVSERNAGRLDSQRLKKSRRGIPAPGGFWLIVFDLR